MFDLVHAVPQRPQPAVYARMVAESGLRREIAGQGVLLRAGALQAALSDSDGPVYSACLIVDAELDSIAQRWATATGAPPPTSSSPIPLRPVTRPPSRSLDLRTGADKYLSAHPSRDRADEHEHTVALIGALIAHPDHIPEVTGWLRPTQVTDPAWRTVYAAAADLAERGQPVDVVTVAWAGRALAQHSTPLPPLRELRDAVDAGHLDQPGRAARIVAGEQVRALADNAAHQLIRGTDNAALEIGELVDTGHLLTNALRQTALGLPSPRAIGAFRGVVVAPELRRGPVAG